MGAYIGQNNPTELLILVGLGIIATIVLYGIGVAIATKLVTGGQA